jgi:hypothetical protein
MTLADIRTRVRSLTSILSSSILSDSEMDAFINEAQTLICLTADWPFLVHTVSATVDSQDDTVVLTLPAGRTAQRVVDVFASIDVGDKPWQLFERAQPTIVEDTSGYPREYEWDSDTNTLRLYPIPSTSFAITVRVVLDPKNMTSGTDVPIVPVAFRHGIAYMASALILEREADTTGRIAAYERRVAEVIEEMRRLLLTSGRATFTIGGRVGRRRSARVQVW